MDKNNPLADLRKNYQQGELIESLVNADPFQQFDQWLQEALQHEGIYEANAMTLATSNTNGFPSVRTVLLKGVQDGGFIFYTNHQSRKGQELAENPKVALLFYWGALHRQVRIEGMAKKLSEDFSTQYFQSRPKGSQIGAWASPQSQVIASRHILEDNQKKLEAQYQDIAVLPKPKHWGGYLVKAQSFEFWQGRPSRLHDRLRYRLNEKNEWLIERLAP